MLRSVHWYLLEDVSGQLIGHKFKFKHIKEKGGTLFSRRSVNRILVYDICNII